ncbi:formate dehydrogenase subunit delta [Dokdonella sp.]|uniref:formate dehydrogenase subunit delta n=1 Tax=Dokdonella sp. TaxID=2291710 RepID=UPI003C3EB189
MDAHRLVAMANDIANYFESEPDREAGIDGIADHLRKFWDPRMRRQLIAYLEADGDGLGELARAGVQRLAAS